MTREAHDPVEAELRRLYPANGRGRPKGRPNTTTIHAAIRARELRVHGFVGRHLGELIADLVGRERPFTGEELVAAEKVLADAIDRGLALDVPPPSAPRGAKDARRVQSLHTRHLQLADVRTITIEHGPRLIVCEHTLEVVDNYAAYSRAIGQPERTVKLYEAAAADLRTQLAERNRRLAIEAFEQGHERRQQWIESGNREFAVSAENTVRREFTASGRPIYKSTALDFSGFGMRWRDPRREHRRWEYRRDQWQLAHVGETCGMEAMEELRALQKEQRRHGDRHARNLSLDYEYQTENGVTTLYDRLPDTAGTLAPPAREDTKVERAAELICSELGDFNWHPTVAIRERLLTEGLNHPQVITDAKRHILTRGPLRVQHDYIHGTSMWRLTAVPRRQPAERGQRLGRAEP